MDSSFPNLKQCIYTFACNVWFILTLTLNYMVGQGLTHVETSRVLLQVLFKELDAHLVACHHS
jgi:hypothetical protein